MFVKSKMSLPKKIFLWVFGILVILAIVAVVMVPKINYW